MKLQLYEHYGISELSIRKNGDAIRCMSQLRSYFEEVWLLTIA